MTKRHILKSGFTTSFAILCTTMLLSACTLDAEEAGVAAGSVTLSWNAPSERADASGLDMGEIGGYRIYYRTASGDYPYLPQFDIPDASVMEVTVPVPAGNYFVVMTTYDAQGRESAFSSPEVEIKI